MAVPAAVAVHEALDRLLRIEARYGVQSGGKVVRMGDVPECQLRDLVLGVTHHLAESVVDDRESPVEIDPGDTHPGELEGCAKPLLTLRQCGERLPQQPGSFLNLSHEAVADSDPQHGAEQGDDHGEPDGDQARGHERSLHLVEVDLGDDPQLAAVDDPRGLEGRQHGVPRVIAADHGA